METKIGDFFTLTNSVENITDKDYQQVEFLVNAAKAFARSTYQCVYIIDYFKKGFVYVSDNLAYLCGQPASRIKEFGYELYIQHVPPRESAMLKEINDKGFALFNNIPYADRMDYTITYDFHIINGRKKHLVNHKLTPLVLTKDGRIWLALCTISLSARNTPGKIIMRKENSDMYYEYSLERKNWIKKQCITLSPIEKDVLRLSTQGYTMKDIAEKLYKSVDTIKACKRAMFAKLEVKNIAEALFFAANYKML